MNKTVKKGLLIYNQVDYEKNKWFAHELINKAAQFDLELSLVLRENLVLTIENGSFLASAVLEPSLTMAAPSVAEPSLTADLSTLMEGEIAKSKVLSPLNVEFVINRTRDTIIGVHFEKMGCRVFNTSEVTEICNHKGKTHQLINSAGIPSVKTLLGNVHYFSPSMLPFAYPVILKAVSGHGGSEIYKISNEAELEAHLKSLRTEDFILQELCSNPGIDIRVFTLGTEILAAVKRQSTESFKSNYSLGGLAIAYTLTPEEKSLVKRILSLLDFDLVGIDFILDQEGRFLFNEIEDVVGTRTLYLNYDLDVVSLYLNYIANAF